MKVIAIGKLLKRETRDFWHLVSYNWHLLALVWIGNWPYCTVTLEEFCWRSLGYSWLIDHQLREIGCSAVYRGCSYMLLCLSFGCGICGANRHFACVDAGPGPVDVSLGLNHRFLNSEAVHPSYLHLDFSSAESIHCSLSWRSRSRRSRISSSVFTCPCLLLGWIFCFRAHSIALSA